MIFVKIHTLAMASKVVLEVTKEGDHMLQTILREKYVDLLEQRWGTRDYTWLVAKDRTKPRGESKL